MSAVERSEDVLRLFIRAVLVVVEGRHLEAGLHLKPRQSVLVTRLRYLEEVWRQIVLVSVAGWAVARLRKRLGSRCLEEHVLAYVIQIRMLDASLEEVRLLVPQRSPLAAALPFNLPGLETLS